MSSLTDKKLDYSTSASTLQKIRKASSIPIPSVLKFAPNLEYENHEALGAVADHEHIQKAFPATYGRARISLKPTSSASTIPAMKIGVVLSGGQAPGGHNVIAGIYDYAKKVSANSSIIGFLDGPQGIYTGQFCVIDDAMMDNYRNTGGFDMIGSGRHKIEKPEHFAASMQNCITLGLTGLVIIGGDDSNTNAALLAEYFEANNCPTKVCGCPKTIDGDLKVDPYIPISFGFDTACRTYSELIGNLGQDTLSSQKYYHFVRLMGRAASNIALECALFTRPNVCLISEEVEAKRMTLAQITKEVVDTIVMRSQMGKSYGIVLLPEGLIEFIPEFNSLIANINDVLATGVATTEEAVRPLLSVENQSVFDYLPELIKHQLLLDRDPHGNVQVAKIETERLLAQTVGMELEKLRAEGRFDGDFNPQFHSYGYEGRSCLPSVFDATYCYILGQNVCAMISLGLNGLISSVTNLLAPVSEWKCGGVPITMMCHMEKRHGHMKPVIKKALVELDGEPFKCFSAQRADWARFDLYRSPGPIQFFPQSDNVDLCITLGLELAKSDKRMDLADLEAAKSLQLSAKKYGAFVHAPLSKEASVIFSETQRSRSTYRPSLCPSLKGAFKCAVGQVTNCSRFGDREIIKALFPSTFGAPLVKIEASDSPGQKLRVGIAFLGRQAPGGHDIISGIFDAIGSESTLVGFIGGSAGLTSGYSIELTADMVDTYRGQGGFEILTRATDRIEDSQFPMVKDSCLALQLDGLVLIGGSKTNTTAAYLSEYMKANSIKTKIVTVPVDISSSLKSQFVETTVGFDTATKVAGQIVGNNATDGGSAKKYYYFMRLIGDEPSHSALEVALSTKPNYVILAEEIEAKNMSLADIVNSIADVVALRASMGKNYGTVLIPEGIVESIPELKNLISEIDAIYASSSGKVDNATIRSQLTIWSKALLESLPDFMQSELLLTRGSDNKIPISQAEMERLLARLVEVELGYRKKRGYQARGSSPSNFDVTYAYNLGYAAVALISGGFTGYIATINYLNEPITSWIAGGVPIVALLTAETPKPSVPKAKVDLSGPVYNELLLMRRDCATLDNYENPGPLQYGGPSADSIPKSLELESFDYLKNIQKLQEAMANIESSCRPGCSPTLLSIAVKNLASLSEVMDLLKNDSKRVKLT